jgi:hypothetical protein
VDYVVSWSDFIRRDAQGHVLVDSRTIALIMEPGRSFWGEALPVHSLENVGSNGLPSSPPRSTRRTKSADGSNARPPTDVPERRN